MSLPILLILAGAAAPLVRAADQHYIGTAYGPSGSVAYREEHWVYDETGVTMRLVLYRCAAGAPFARKLVREASSSTPDFDFVDARSGYREGVRVREGQREVYVQESTQAPLKSAPLPARGDAVIDAGFDSYVRGRWAELSGAGVQVPFLVPSRLGFLNLKLAGASTGSESGERVRQLRMSLDAWYGFVAPAIDLTYTEAGRRLLRFQGVSNVRDESGKSQNVRIEFPAAGRLPPASREEVAAAAVTPLVKSCAG